MEFMIGLHLRLSKYPKEGFLLINGSLVADVRLDVGFIKCSLTFSREIFIFFFSPPSLRNKLDFVLMSSLSIPSEVSHVAPPEQEKATS